MATKTGKQDLSPSDVDEPEQEDEVEEEEELPRVVVGMLAELGDAVPGDLRQAHGERAVWFLREQDSELAEVFERLPEGRIEKTTADAILGALRQFSLRESEALQEVMGATDSLRYAFHVDAALEEVIESFEDDGFAVMPVQVIYNDSTGQ